MNIEKNSEIIISLLNNLNSRSELINGNIGLYNFILRNKELRKVLDEKFPTKPQLKRLLLSQGKSKCTCCNNIFDLDNFNLISKNNPSKGYRHYCKKCFIQKTKEVYIKKMKNKPLNPGGRLEYIQLFSEGKKRCPSCNEIKQIYGDYHVNKKTGKIQSKCNSCMVVYRRKVKPIKEDTKLRYDLHYQGLKKCPSCNEIKPYNEYGKNKNVYLGVASMCKKCKSERDRQYRNDPKHREKNLNKKKEYYERTKHTERHKENQKRNQEKRDYKIEHIKRKEDEFSRFKDMVRKSVNSVFTRIDKKWIKKDTKTEILLGANFFVVKEFIERQFIEGMTWENYGSVWHFDHTIPLDAADKDKDKVIELCNYKNLSPMFCKENLAKGCKIPNVCTLFKNSIVPYKECDIIIEPKFTGVIGRYREETPIGKKFDKLTILSDTETRIIGKDNVERRMVTCRCDCGIIKDISYSMLKNGRTKSCGCEQKIKASLYNSTQKKTTFTNKELIELREIIHTIPKWSKPPKDLLKKYEGRNYTQLVKVLRDIRNGTLKRLNHI